MRDLFPGFGYGYGDELKTSFSDPNDGFPTHAGNVYATWPNKAILRELREFEENARRWGGRELHVELMCSWASEWFVFPRIFNLLIGNGFRWLGDSCFVKVFK